MARPHRSLGELREDADATQHALARAAAFADATHQAALGEAAMARQQADAAGGGDGAAVVASVAEDPPAAPAVREPLPAGETGDSFITHLPFQALSESGGREGAVLSDTSALARLRPRKLTAPPPLLPRCCHGSRGPCFFRTFWTRRGVRG